jgi:hypothetical protein
MKVIIICLFVLQINSCNSNDEVIKANSSYCLNTSDKAIEQAEKKWLEIYGSSIYDKKPFIAKLENDTIWIIQGSLKSSQKGGVPYAEINAKNCEFIKVTHGK